MKTLIVLSLAASLGFCSSPAQKAALGKIEGSVAGVLESPITQSIASFAAQAAVNSLIASGSKSTGNASQQAEIMAADALTSGVSSAFLSSAAGALRALQSTNQAASAASVAAAVADAGAPAIADSVSKAITSIANTLPALQVGEGNASNEAVASALDTLAAKTAKN